MALGEPAAEGVPSPRRDVVPRDAGTLVLVRPGRRGPEVLLTRRPPSMAFAPGVHVFPGGAVSPDDRAVARGVEAAAAAGLAAHRMGEEVGSQALAALVAAIREAREEVGIDIAGDAPEADSARDGAGLDRLLEAVQPLARWVTPPSFERRFDTRFLVAAVPPGTEARPDPHEVEEVRWVTPGAALDEHRAGRLGLWLPTAAVLALLAAAAETLPGPGAPDAVQAFLRALPVPTRPGTFSAAQVGDALTRLDLPSVAGVPGRTGVAWLVGRRCLVTVDPGDPDPAVLDAIVAEAAARDASIEGVIVTSQHPERAAGALDLAARLDVPALCGVGGAGRLPIPFTELAVGDVVPGGDVPLIVEAAGGGPGEMVLALADGRRFSPRDAPRDPAERAGGER